MSNGKCYRCDNFSRYYTRGVKRFDRTNLGWCFAKGECVDAQDGCEKFVPRKLMKKPSFALSVCLNSLMTDISALRNIIEEEIGENEDM